MEAKVHKVRTPHFPRYSVVRHLLQIWAGVPKDLVRSLIQEVSEQMGSPQNPVDWSEPGSWIPERLSGEVRELASRIWEQSEHAVNPRYTYGSYMFINSYQLLLPDSGGVYRLTPRGEAFLKGQPEIIRELDEAEGLPELLAILATKPNARRADLLPEWEEFLRQHSNLATPSSIKGALSVRLLNLVERGLASREGNTYTATQQGIDYASSIASTEVAADPRLSTMLAVKTYNTGQREALRERLGKMHPYRFEHLVRDLLEAMGYEDVTVTQASGDKGVDVVATVQFGITTITEVIQVKRHQASVGRPVLDQLRGALPYHKAIRGVIITLGNFSKGCKDAAFYAGAAPIGLINGEKLLDLLIEHEVGIRKQAVQLYQLDEDLFTLPVEGSELVEAGSAVVAE